MGLSRAEHLAWCKERAREYVAAGDLVSAQASLVQDLALHPDTKAVGATVAELGMLQMMSGQLSNARDMTQWIDGVL
jgi:hypothetical protein